MNDDKQQSEKERDSMARSNSHDILHRWEGNPAITIDDLSFQRSDLGLVLAHHSGLDFLDSQLSGIVLRQLCLNQIGGQLVRALCFPAPHDT